MPAHAPPLFSPTTGPIVPIAWPTMVIMVTADPLLPKLESPPARPTQKPLPGGREQRSILPPAPLCLSFLTPFPSGGRGGIILGLP